MIKWILENIGIVVVLVVFLSQIVRAFLRARNSSPRPEAKRDEMAEERRVREVQEQIRRQIAARRGGSPAAEAPSRAPEGERPPVPSPQTTQLPEPFGGPLGRMLEELQRRAQQHIPPPPLQTQPPVLSDRRHLAELERQQQLADELKSAEETRHLVQRRAVHLAADRQTLAESEPALRAVARDQVLGDLRDPQSLRRAFVLREVLGKPVGMR